MGQNKVGVTTALLFIIVMCQKGMQCFTHYYYQLLTLLFVAVLFSKAASDDTMDDSTMNGTAVSVPDDDAPASDGEQPKLLKMETDTTISKDGGTKIISMVEIHPSMMNADEDVGQQEPMGPPGPAGPEGPAGVTGPQGLPGQLQL